MSGESNKQVVRRVFDEVINQEKREALDEIVGRDVIVHDSFTGTHQGLEALKGLLGMFDEAFPHHRVSVEGMYAEDDYVAVLHTHTATNTGSFMGMPPTGRTITVNGLELFRMVHGKIAEFWRKDDDASMLIQLGILAIPQAA